jgi:hypothetical protein
MQILVQHMNTSASNMGSKVVFGGDATRDGYVNFDDLLLVSQVYGTAYGVNGGAQNGTNGGVNAGSNGPTYKLEADFNLDGKVDYIDLAILAANYNTYGPKLGMQKSGDVNRDGVVNFDDMLAASQALNSHVGQSPYVLGADFDQDGDVDTGDMQKVQAAYGG